MLGKTDNFDERPRLNLGLLSRYDLQTSFTITNPHGGPTGFVMSDHPLNFDAVARIPAAAKL